MSIPRDRPRGRCSSPENPGLRSEFLSETLRWTWAFAERLSIKSNCSAQLRSIMQLRIKACSCAAFSLMTARLSRAYYTKETSSIANNTVSPAEACTFIWHVLMLYNASNLRFETHIQHSISFIQHDVSVPQNDQDNCLASQSTQCPCWKHLVVQASTRRHRLNGVFTTWQLCNQSHNHFNSETDLFSFCKTVLNMLFVWWCNTLRHSHTSLCLLVQLQDAIKKTNIKSG